MLKQFDRKGARARRHRRVRVKLAGTAQKPRLSVYRSLHHVYAQLIDDEAGRTVAAASTAKLKSGRKDVDAAAAVGRAIAEGAKTAGGSSAGVGPGRFLVHRRRQAAAD